MNKKIYQLQLHLCCLKHTALFSPPYKFFCYDPEQMRQSKGHHETLRFPLVAATRSPTVTAHTTATTLTFFLFPFDENPIRSVIYLIKSALLWCRRPDGRGKGSADATPTAQESIRTSVVVASQEAAEIEFDEVVCLISDGWGLWLRVNGLI